MMRRYVFQFLLIWSLLSLLCGLSLAEESHIPDVKTLDAHGTTLYAVCDEAGHSLHAPTANEIFLNRVDEYEDALTGERYTVCMYVMEKEDKAGTIALYIQPGDLFSGFVYEEYFGFSEGLAPVSQDGRFGYIDLRGAWSIPAQWEWAESFRNGYAMVTYRTQNGYANAWIDHDGVIVSLKDPEDEKE